MPKTSNIFLILFSTVFIIFIMSLAATGQDNDGKEPVEKSKEENTPLEVPRSPEEKALQKDSDNKEDKDCYDKVILKDGTAIKGRIIDPGGPTIRVEQKLGAVSVLKNQIKQLVLNENREDDSTEDIVHLKTGGEIKGRVTADEEGKDLVIEVSKDGAEHKVKLPREDVLKIEWARDKKKRIAKQIESFEDPFIAVVVEMVKALSSEDEKIRLDAENKLKGLGVFATEYLKDMLSDLEEPVLSRVKKILRIAEIKSYVSAGAVESLKKDVYDILVGGSADEKQTIIRQIMLLEDDGAVSLLTHIARQKEEEVVVRNFCLHSLATSDHNHELLKLMTEAEDKDGWLRLACALHLADNGIYAGAPHFISALRMRDPGVRQMAIKKLRLASNRNFGFDPEGEEAKREQAIKKWEAWWQESNAEILRQSAKQMSIKPISDDDRSFSELYQNRGHNSWDKGKIEEAKENFKKSLELDPANLSARLSLAVLLYSGFKENREARREIELILKRYGKEAGTLIRKLSHYHLALIDLSESEWAPALHNLQASIGLDGRFADGYIALGKTYYIQVVNDETISRETIIGLPEVERRETEQRRRDVIERSVRALEIGLGLIDDDIREYTSLDFRKNRREAERELEEKLGNRSGKNNEGESEILFRDALLKKKAKACAMLADSYALQLEWRKAARCLSDAAGLAPEEPQYLCDLGAALVAAGKTDEAREAFKRCLKLDPQNKMAKEALEDLK